MRHTYKLKTILFIFHLVLLSTFCFSQNQDIKPISNTVPASVVTCSIVANSNCNKVSNDDFNSSVTNIQNPFANNQVSSWIETFGTPALTDFAGANLLPSSLIGYSSMYSWIDNGMVYSEGIAQHIPQLSTDKKYAFSIFTQLARLSEVQLDDFFIVLMHCEDYRDIHTYPTYSIPVMPRNSQVLYTGSSLQGDKWSQITGCFVVNDDYDFVLIYPRQNVERDFLSANLSGINISGLEIISTGEFTAGLPPVITQQNSIANLGPSNLNCSLRNSIFTWLSPNGENFISNQNITIDASDSSKVGTWTLSMGLPPSSEISLSKKCNISSQVDVYFQSKNFPTTLRCDLPPTTNCNLISNSSFQLNNQNCNLENPFYLNCVTGWDYGPRSPQLNTFFTPPNSSVNVASMWSHPSNGLYEFSGGEGIVTGIPRLIPGNRYILTFLKAAVPNPGSPSNSLDEFNFYLSDCEVYRQLETQTAGFGYFTPIPNPAQRIYCEQNASNANLQRVSTSFIAQDNYNFLWIYPRQWRGGSGQWWLGIAQPELIDITNFTAGVSSLNGCEATIGPLTPNCSPSNATFSWIPPGGGPPIPANANQQITINTSLPENNGTWTLQMTIPNAVITNNSCSQNVSTVQATLNVISPCGPTVITTESHFEYGACDPPHNFTNTPIIPESTTNSLCNYWECGTEAFFYSNRDSQNEWFVNDILIPSGGLINTVVGTASIVENTKVLKVKISGGSTQFFKIQLRNLSSGSSQLTTPTFIYIANKLSDGDYIRFYKPNYSTTLGVVSRSGPSAVYSWNIPGVYSGSSTNPTISFTYPADVPLTGITGTLTVSNAICNGIYNINLVYNPYLRNSSDISPQIINNKVSVFPNPTSDRVRFKISAGKIQKIHLTNLSSGLKSRYEGFDSQSISINVSNLKLGVYDATIYSAGDIYHEKIIVRR